MPLRDIRVLETGTVLASAFCGHVLADFGAEVVKIEPPSGRAVDPLRTWGDVSKDGESFYSRILNRNKSFLSLDLSATRGAQLFLELTRQADIVIENFRPGTFEKWGLGYSELKAVNPHVILVRISGFGQTGPYRERAAFGAVAEAMGGLRGVTGYPDRPPVRAGVSIGDYLAGLYGALGALIAVLERRHGGDGQVVDVAIYEAVMSVIEDLIPLYDVSGVVKRPVGTGIPRVAPSNIYRTASGQWVVIAASTDSTFARLAVAMGRSELLKDPRFATQGTRGRNSAEIDQIVREWCMEQGGDVGARLADQGVPAGTVYGAAELLEDPHVRHRKMIVDVEDDQLGSIRMQGVMPKLSGTPGQIDGSAGSPGRDTTSVLKSLLALSEDEISELRVSSII